jgi:ABC-type sugar transport system substrate-binding protein
MGAAAKAPTTWSPPTFERPLEGGQPTDLAPPAIAMPHALRSFSLLPQSSLNLTHERFGDVPAVNVLAVGNPVRTFVNTTRRLLCAALVWSALGSGAAAEARLTVTFVNPGKTGEVFWDLVSATMRAAARQLNIDAEILYAERNHRTLRELAMGVVGRSAPPDYLIIVNEESAATPIIEAANRAGIKTFLLSNAFTGAEAEHYGAPRTVLANWIGSLVPDMGTAGTRMGAALVEAGHRNNWHSADGKLHLLALGGDEKTPNSIARTRGFTSFVEGRADVVMDRLFHANWNATEAETLTDRYLAWAKRSGIRPAGIWSANDPIALGAMRALEKHGLVPGRDIGVVGLNWSPEALAEVKAGRMLLTDGGHFFAGGWSMVMLRDLADACDFAAAGTQQVLPLASIDQTNVAALEDLIKHQRFDDIRYRPLLASARGSCGHYDFSLNALLRAVRVTVAK